MGTLTWTEEDEDGVEHQRAIPHKWEICHSCAGDGTIPDRAISPTGDGSWTGSEFAEACHEDEDFRDHYFGGMYDVACPDCSGSGKTKAIDWTALEQRDPALAKRYEDHLKDEACFEAECAAERRMGA